jgi:protein-S-isoprenylcysteine O-methyltransferase Ste14
MSTPHPIPGTSKEVATSVKIAVLLNLAFIAMAGAICMTVAKANPMPPHFRFFAGVFLGFYAALGKDLFKFVVEHIWQMLANTTSQKKAWRGPPLLLVAACSLFGLICWYVGWEGTTQTAYGVGVFVSVCWYEYGVGKYFQSAYS